MRTSERKYNGKIHGTWEGNWPLVHVNYVENWLGGQLRWCNFLLRLSEKCIEKNNTYLIKECSILLDCTMIDLLGLCCYQDIHTSNNQ